MFVSEGPAGTPSDQVLIVPAREALGTYLEYSAYLCQPNRTFRKVERMGFYQDGKIQPRLPKILGSVESIRISQDWADSVEDPLEADLQRQLGRLINRVLKDGCFEDGELLKVLVLTAKDSAETITLDAPIENDSTKDGRTVAWARSHRYASLQSLRGSKVTSDLQSV